MPDERAVGLPKEWRPPKHIESQKFLVSEIYSPPRVTAEIRRCGFKHIGAGLALDLTVSDPEDAQPLDFSRHAKREKSRRLIRASLPILLIGSPMRTAFSTWQTRPTAAVWCVRLAIATAAISTPRWRRFAMRLPN